MGNPFKKLSKKMGLLSEFEEHLDEARKGKDVDCFYIDALEETWDTVKTWTGCKTLLKDYKRILGTKGVHRNTPWWEKLLFIIYTLYSYFIGFFGIVAILVFIIAAFKIEFIIWLRERAKVKRRKKEVNRIMEKKKQGYDSPSWREE